MAGGERLPPGHRRGMILGAHDDHEVEVGVLIEAAIGQRAGAQQRLEPLVGAHGRNDAIEHARMQVGKVELGDVHVTELTVPSRACYAGRMVQVILDAANLKKAMRHLAKVDPDFARAIKEVGHPELREVPTGFGGLMRSIVGQQVSVHAARSIWLRLEAAAPTMEPAEFLALTDEDLRAVGLSGAKMRYGRSLASDIVEGRIDFRTLARARRRSGHRHADPGQGHRPVDGGDLPDVRPWPARHHAGPRSRPGGRRPAPQEAAQAARRQAAAQNRRAWRPWRSAAALLLWHYRRNMPDWSAKAPKVESKANDQARRPQLRPAQRAASPAIWWSCCTATAPTATT